LKKFFGFLGSVFHSSGFSLSSIFSELPFALHTLNSRDLLSPFFAKFFGSAP